MRPRPPPPAPQPPTGTEEAVLIIRRPFPARLHRNGDPFQVLHRAHLSRPHPPDGVRDPAPPRTVLRIVNSNKPTTAMTTNDDGSDGEVIST